MESFENLKALTKDIIRGFVFATVFIVIALIITRITSYEFKEILFTKAMIAITVGAFSLNTHDTMGLSMQALSMQALLQDNSYVSNQTIEILKKEEEVNEAQSRRFIINVKKVLTSTTLILAGTICIGINFIV